MMIHQFPEFDTGGRATAENGYFPLNEADLASLAASFIDKNTASIMQIYRVDDRAGAAIVCRKREWGKQYSGMVFNYYPPGDEYPVLRRLRLDAPQDKAKYLVAAGERNRLIDVGDRKRRRNGRSDVGPVRGRPSDPDPPLPRLAGEEPNSDLGFLRIEPG